MTRRLLTPLVALLVLVPGSSALADPGRVVVPVAERAPERSVDAGGAASAVALPDGGVAMAGLGELRKNFRRVVVVRLDAAGRPDPSFGNAGVARLTLGQPFFSEQLLVRPDGRLLLIGGIRGDSVGQSGLAAVGVTSDGRLDASFGRGGIARPPVQASCGDCAPAALGADGSLLLAGSAPVPGVSETPVAVVARLTASGGFDPSFGHVGLATPPVSSGRSIFAGAVGVTESGRLLVLTRSSDGLQVSALRSGGAPDTGAGRTGWPGSPRHSPRPARCWSTRPAAPTWSARTGSAASRRPDSSTSASEAATAR